MDNKYENLIKNKTVALVGPAKYMENSNLGTEIDSHDYVVRLNRGIELLQTRSKDIGSKCNIFYTCLIEKAENTGKLNANTLKNLGIEFVVAPPDSNIKGISTATVPHPDVNLKTIQEIKNCLPFRLINHKFHTELAEHINCRPNTGFLAIYDLLKHSPKKLSLYGFSFYLDGFDSAYKADVKMDKNDFVNKCFKSTRHVQKNMWKYAKRTLLNNSIVSLDKTLYFILNLNNFSREEYEKKERNA